LMCRKKMGKSWNNVCLSFSG